MNYVNKRCRIIASLKKSGAKMEAVLRSCSLEELKKEPWRLQIQAENTAEQLRNLVLKNYHVFIQSNQSANIVKDDVRQLDPQRIAFVSDARLLFILRILSLGRVVCAVGGAQARDEPHRRVDSGAASFLR